MTDPKGVPAVPHVPARSRQTATLVLLALLAGGLAGGVLLDRYVLLPNRVMVTRSPRRDGGNRGDMRRRFSEWMTKELALSPTQREQMDTIFAHQFAAMDSVTKIMRPSIDSIMKRAQRSVDSVLTPDQRTKLVELRKRRPGGPGRGGPGGGRGGPGGPGGPGRPDSGQ